MAKVKVLISDESQLVREGIARILASEAIEVAGEMRSMVEVLQALRAGQTKADLLLADPTVESEEQFEAMEQIRQEFPELYVVILTSRTSPAWLEKAIGAGADGFLPKDMSGDALRFSLELVLLGERIFPMIRSMLKAGGGSDPPDPPKKTIATSDLVPLSKRESQILQCLVDGLPNKTIARNLDMAEATVKVHLKSILRKLNVQNRTQAAIWGMNHAQQLRGGYETLTSHRKEKHG